MVFYIKQFLKMVSQHVLFPICYAWYRRKPVIRNYVIFADAHKDACPMQMERLRDALKEEGYHVKSYYFNLNSLSTFSGMKKMLGFMKLYARAEYVILQDNFLPVASCHKRKETKVIQLWHGCGAFKKFGYDAEDDIPAYYKGNVYRNYDLVTVSSPYCCSYFASAMRITDPAVVQATGVSYTDCYFDAGYRKSALQKFESIYGKKNGRKVIVWAPTFRGNAGVQTGAEEGRQLPGEKAVEKLEQNHDYLVIKSLHPHMLHGKKQTISTGELLIAADVLITDYSSVFFEYLLLDRPIVFLAPDLQEYRKRGWYLAYEELPGQIVTEEADLPQAVADALQESEIGKDEVHKRREFRERYMSSCDGKATERILQYIKGKETEEKG